MMPSNIVLKAALPGVEKKDISVDLKGRVLTLKGTLSSEAEVKEDNYYRKERASGKFERSFTMPGDVDPEKITGGLQGWYPKNNSPTA